MTTRDDVEGLYRLSFAQQGLIYHSLTDPVSAFYVDQVVYTLDGELDVAALEQVWRRAVRRHAVLRTSFHWQGLDELVQVVHTDVDLPMRVLDRTGAPPAEVRRFIVEDRAQGFDLDSPPLFRLTLLRTAADSHTFVFRYHHALLDAWSALMLLDEVFTGYPEALRDRLPSAAGPLPYHEYVAWLHGQDLEEAERYWRRALAGVTAPTPPPGARRRAGSGPTEGEPENRELRTVLPEQVTSSLEELARAQRITLNSVLEGIWAVLLARFAGTDDVVFGTTVTNRPPELDGVQETLGLFINTVPARVGVPGEASFVDCCARIHADRAQRRAYDYSPLADVQAWSELPAGTPLFETIMTFLNVPGIEKLDGREGTVGGLTVREGEYRYRTNYPVSVMVIPGREISVRLAYDPERLTGDAAGRLLDKVRMVAEAVAADPTVRVADIPLLSDVDRETVLARPNRTAAGHALDRSLPDLISERAREARAAAIAHGEERITYEELEGRVNQLARHLLSSGVSGGARVGLCLGRGPDLVIALLAVLRAGAAYVPLDPAYPDERLRYLLADADVSVLVTERSLRDRLPRQGRRTVLVDAHRRTIDRQSTEPPDVRVRPEDLAYVIYTSGSTGTPKGVMVEHRGLVNLAGAQASRFGLGADDRVLQWASASFDASIFEIVMALTAGATLCTAAQEDVAPGPGLAKLLAHERITVLTIPPSALSAVPESSLPDLRTLVVAGEALPENLVDRWSGQRRMVNAYGPTEATVWVSAHDCLLGEPEPPIGSPVDNTQVYVLDAAMRPAPVEVAAELYVGGAGLARGYLGRQGLTASRFVANPFGQPGSRLYRTGDLARWRADGELEFVGRADGQVKLRGFRIETGEIEAVLRGHLAVRDVAVVVRKAGDGDTSEDGRLVAYHVPEEGQRAGDAELREFARERLPEHMVPASFSLIERIPVNANGKRDLAALPDQEVSAPDDEPGQVAPRTPAEELLADIWAGVLGTDRVSVTDDFFRVGGNSIKGTLLTSRVARACEVELPLRKLMELRTIEACAAYLEEAMAEQPAGTEGKEPG